MTTKNLFTETLARAVRNEFPEAPGLVDLATDYDFTEENLDEKAAQFFAEAAGQAAKDGLGYITAEALERAYNEAV